MLAVVLLIGSAAAFARSEKLKLVASPVAKPEFDRHLSPTCGCARRTAQLSLLLRRPERLDASVVDADGGHVATLVEGRELPGGRAVFDWSGRDDDGQIVPDGRYRLKIRLEHDRRTILIPKTIVVDTAPPRAELIQAVRTADGVEVRYRTNESAHVLLRLNGRTVARNGPESGKGTLEWAPAGVAATEGLVLVAVDRSGNRSVPVPVLVLVASS